MAIGARQEFRIRQTILRRSDSGIGSARLSRPGCGERMLDSCDDAKAPWTARVTCGLHDDLDIPAEQGQKAHEPLGGETGKLPAQQPGDFGLVNLEHARGLNLRQAAASNGFGNADGQAGFRETFFGVGQSDVAKTFPVPSSIRTDFLMADAPSVLRAAWRVLRLAQPQSDQLDVSLR